MEGYKTNYRVLIADDDPNVHQSLSPYFRREGYEIFSSYDGEDAVEKARSLKPDMIILDIMMPRKDGLAVCREIRREANIPVIMLSAKGEEFDKLLGLELGADDYITKPFSPREVLARVKAVLRRLHEIKDESKGTIVRIENLEIDMSAFIVKLNDQPVPCTPKEIEILYTLASIFCRASGAMIFWATRAPSTATSSACARSCACRRTGGTSRRCGASAIALRSENKC